MATERPEIAALWHATKNQKKPTEYLPNSSKKVWWQCPVSELHEWDAQINALANGQGCAFCSGKRVCSDNCLANLEPEIAALWHPTKNRDTPEDITIGSMRPRWWLCKFGHEWQAGVATRVKGHGCSKCSNQFSKLELRIFCELDALLDNVRWRDRHLGKELDIFLPDQKVGIEIDYMHTHGDKLKQDKEKNKLVLSHGITLIRVREAKLGAMTAADVLFKKSDSEKSVVMRLTAQLCMLLKDESIKAKLGAYISRDKLIAQKGFKKIFARSPAPPLEESVEYLYPHLVNEWDYELNHPLLPNMFTKGSGQKINWKCQECGERWLAIITERTGSARHKPTGCPSCAGIIPGQPLASRNRSHINADYNLLALHTDIASEYHPTRNELPVDEVAPNTHDAAWWKCVNGHEWQQRVVSRTKHKIGERGCPICRSIAVARPDLAKEWDSDRNIDTPRDVTVGSKGKKWWKCLNGHPSYQAVVYSRVAGKGCRICGYQKNVYAGKQRRMGVIEEVRRIKAEGAVSIGEIADKLNQMGLKTPRGNSWTVVNLRSTLWRK